MSNNHTRFRASRDRLIELAPHLIPNPLPDLPIIPTNFRPILSTDDLVVGTVEKGETAMIYIDESQRGVIYQLKTKAGDNVGAAREGNCQRIAFETAILTADEWYEFYVLATRISTQVSKVLDTRIWINAGNIDGVDPRPLFATPRWQATYTVVIPDTQPNLQWQLMHGNGDPASEPIVSTLINSSENTSTTTTTITLNSYPLIENGNLIIQVVNLLTNETKNLSQTPEIKVYPNPNLIFFNHGTPQNPHWNEPVEVQINLPQPTVRYQLMHKVGETLIPSGDAQMGAGNLIILRSAPLKDIASLKVLAVKIDGDLEEYLLGEIEITVYPDPSIEAELVSEIIDFATAVQVQIPDPQEETTYFLHLGDGIPLGTTVVSDGNAFVLTSLALQEDQDIYVRATRRGLSADLSTILHVYVRPNLGLSVELPHTQFNRIDGTEIWVHNTQTSVVYALFKIPATWEASLPVIECSRLRGNGGKIILETRELNADQYTFYVTAFKHNPQSLGRLLNSIELEVSLRSDTAVVGGTSRLDYERSSSLQINDRQTFVNYTPVSGSRIMGARLEYDQPNAPLHTELLREDVILQVQADHFLTGESIVLDFHFQVLIGPNLRVEVTAPQPHPAHGQEAILYFSEGQASVTYEIRAEANLFGGPTPEGFIQNFSPAQDGPFSVGFGPLTFPVQLMIVARKTVNRMADALNSWLTLTPYPDPQQAVAVTRQPAEYGGTAQLEITATDWYTKYALQLGDTTPIGNQATNQAPSLISLTSNPLQEDTHIYVYASSTRAPIGLQLQNVGSVWVPPNLNLLPSLHETPFDPEIGAFIRLPDSQVSAQYQLEIAAGDQLGFSTAQLQPRRANGGGDTILPTGPLSAMRYQIRVYAEKQPSGISGYMATSIEFYVRAITDNQVAALSTPINYQARAEITIYHTQPHATYQLFSRENQPLSPIVSSTSSPHLLIPTIPLQENQEIQIQITNLHTGFQDFLDQTIAIQVRPNLNIS
ncbi:MAG TPA: hypothetical protein ENJ82_07735, partial [Bacteroidetes bacterium]|nr:hypothetical protein [Bacteroidota bacterium]